jgi:hypothetical protein
MNDEWQWWALLFGICLGAAGYWLVRERLPRREEDLDLVERAEEAAWISRSVERMGGEAPPEVVSAVLELHREYLTERAPAPAWRVGESTDPVDELRPQPQPTGDPPPRSSVSPSRRSTSPEPEPPSQPQAGGRSRRSTSTRADAPSPEAPPG